MKLNPQGGAEARFRKALDGGRFLIQRCGHCGKHVFYPREVCPHCSAADLDLVAPIGTGTVYSSTVVRRKPESGGDYNVALVDLDEGVRLMSRVDGIPPTEVKIGMRVRARVVVSNGAGLVVFEPGVAP